MSITVRVHPVLTQYTGGLDTVVTEGRTIGECLDNLDAKYPGIKQIYLALSASSSDDLSKTLADGDVFSISIAMGGG
jgi:molybdopterin converting factor small subunit